jgi:hypothetical protein
MRVGMFSDLSMRVGMLSEFSMSVGMLNEFPMRVGAHAGTDDELEVVIDDWDADACWQPWAEQLDPIGGCGGARTWCGEHRGGVWWVQGGEGRGGEGSAKERERKSTIVEMWNWEP